MRHASHEERIKQGPLAAAVPIISAVTSVAGLFMNKQKSAPAPVIEKPAVMPTPDDESAKLAKRRSIAQQIGRSGRESTFLTSGDELGA